MAVKVRLTRVGSKKNPIWRVVVADGRAPRDGRFIEAIGHYNPQTEPSRIVIDRERLQHWLDRGAQPSNTVRKLIRAENTGYEMPDAPAPAAPPRPGEPAAEADAPAAEAAEPAAEADAASDGAEGGPGEEPAADDTAAEPAAGADENP